MKVRPHEHGNVDLGMGGLGIPWWSNDFNFAFTAKGEASTNGHGTEIPQIAIKKKGIEGSFRTQHCPGEIIFVSLSVSIQPGERKSLKKESSIILTGH